MSPWSVFVFTRKWVKERRASEFWDKYDIKGNKMHRLWQSTAGREMQTNFLLIHPSHLRDFPHLPTQTTSHGLSLWTDSGPYANAIKTDIYEKLGIYKKWKVGSYFEVYEWLFRNGNFATYSNMLLFLRKRVSFHGKPLLNVDFGWSRLSYSQLEESPLQYVPFVCMLAFSDCSWRLGKCVEKPVILLPYDQIVSSLCVHIVFHTLSLNLGLLSFLHISLPILK